MCSVVVVFAAAAAEAVFGKVCRPSPDVAALALEIIGDGAPKAGMGDVVSRMGGDGQIAARQLVLALRAGLDPRQTLLDREIDGLMVADLEMQEGVVLDAAPVPAVRGYRRR